MPASKPLAERLLAKVDKSGECWIWTGAKSLGGYGRIGTSRSGGTDQVHRVAYRIYVGQIPDGLHIDHLCNNRLCANPDHLEAVTQAENNRRAGKVRRENQTHCKHGHEYTLENTMRQRGDHRQCRACHNLHNRANRTGQTFARLLEGGPDDRPVIVLDAMTHEEDVAA